MAKVKCPRCFEVNPDGQTTCLKCGTALPRIRIEVQAPPQPAGELDEIQFQRGQVLANRYTVLDLIGRGGMGCIYKVHDNILGEEVALKTLLPRFVQDKLLVERFFNEARIARRLAHPNIVRVHDIGNAGKIVYISMEYLRGQSLRDVLEKLPAGKRLPMHHTLRVIDELCTALEYAHRYTVHRDIKPENVMIARDGSVKLMDFGISKLMANTRLTGASMVMGTPFYMSPEQLRNSRDVDARSDLYSVGVMLYEILTGNMPTGVPRPASEMTADMPPALDTIVARCVDPDPSKRYQNASELRTALRPIRELVDSGSQIADKTVRKPQHKEWPWRRLSGLGLTAVLMLSIAFVLYLLEARRHRLVNAQAPQYSTATTDGAQAPLDALVAYVAQIKKRAAVEARNSEARSTLCQDADEWWQLAQDELQRGGGRAEKLMRQTLQCYLAVLLQPQVPDLVYVPPGRVVLGETMAQVDAFFIDEAEVTLGTFAAFCQSVAGGWREEYAEIDPGLADYPVTGIAFYDAQACAASLGKHLPTEAQWARAAYGDANPPAAFPWGDEWIPGAGNLEYGEPAPVRSFEMDRTPAGCWDMAGNVAEWTRTPAAAAGADAESLAPGFGVEMVICGGHFASGSVPLDRSASLVYEYHGANHVGFRCVLELPDHPAAAEALLTRLRTTPRE